jgi:hypothetical protein
MEAAVVAETAAGTRKTGESLAFGWVLSWATGPRMGCLSGTATDRWEQAPPSQLFLASLARIAAETAAGTRKTGELLAFGWVLSWATGPRMGCLSGTATERWEQAPPSQLFLAPLAQAAAAAAAAASSLLFAPARMHAAAASSLLLECSVLHAVLAQVQAHGAGMGWICLSKAGLKRWIGNHGRRAPS